MNQKYEIDFYEDLHAHDLRIAWERLGKTSTYPQMHFNWLEPWIRLRMGQRKLRVFTAKLDNDIILIAPFCIEKKLGIRTLVSVPIHYGDRYEFIHQRGLMNIDIVHKLVLKEIYSSKSYAAVIINQVLKGSELYHALSAFGVPKTSLVKCPLTTFETTSYSDFFNSLKGKVRRNYKSRLKKLLVLGDIQFEINDDSVYYEQHQGEFRVLYEKRWRNIDSSLPDDNYYECRRQSFTAMLDKKHALNIVLKLDGKVIGYRLGFLHDNIYYDWKICYDVEYSKYGLGAVMTAKLVEDLINKGVRGVI